MRPETPVIDVRVVAIRDEARGVRVFELEAVDAQPLPAFDAGAHIDVLLPGLTRSYSLCRSSDGRRYVIAVSRSATSRGGSRAMHEEVGVGDRLRVQGPSNHFRLDEQAGRCVFVAGGIGITPILPMLERLNILGRPWVLHFSCSTRDAAPFLGRVSELAAGGKGAVHHYFTAEGDPRVPLSALAGQATPQTHLYCCGPAGMIAAFEAATQHLDPACVHVEHFSSTSDAATDGGYVVVLSKRGVRLQVDRGCTILDTLLAHGVDVPSSCREGVCGLCETRVLDGVPDHRDQVLSRAEQAANQSMMICCSGARSTELVLEL